MEGYQCNIHREEHKVLLVIFSDTVVHPGTVMIHLFDAAFAHTAVVSSVGFDAAALGTLVHHLSWFQLQALDEFFGGIPFGYGSRVCAHGLGVRGEGEERQPVEDEPVEKAVHDAFGRQQHDEHHHKLGVEDQEPGDGAAHDAAAVADEPHGVGAAVGRWGGAVLGLQVAGLPLDVPGALRRALHPTGPVAPTACCGDPQRPVCPVKCSAVPLMGFRAPGAPKQAKRRVCSLRRSARWRDPS